MPVPERPLPYSTRECREHWHVMNGDVDIIVDAGDKLDAGTAYSEAARLNIEWLQAEVSRLSAEQQKYHGRLDRIRLIVSGAIDSDSADHYNALRDVLEILHEPKEHAGKNVWPNGAILSCKKCRFSQRATSKECGEYLARGWPRHCGATMNLDEPAPKEPAP